MTISTVKLWFADYDPYRTIFGLGWLFEFNAVEQWPAYTIALAILRRLVLHPALLVQVHLSAGRRAEPGQPREPAAHPPHRVHLQELCALFPPLPGRHRGGEGRPAGEHQLHRLPGLRRDLSPPRGAGSHVHAQALAAARYAEPSSQPAAETAEQGETL